MTDSEMQVLCMCLEFSQAMIFSTMRAVYASSIEHICTWQYICSERYHETPKLKIKMFITETVNNNKLHKILTFS